MYNEHNKNSNKEDTWAKKQILDKSQTRLNALSQSEYSLHTKIDGSVDFLKNDMGEIRTYVIRIKADSPELQAAVNKYIIELKSEFPDYDIRVEYGYKKVR